MSVYWLDPYAEAACGGIHGTVNATTRNGSYSYPFVFSDMFTSSSAGISSINGVTISGSDEIRIKGLASETSFAFVASTGSGTTVSFITSGNPASNHDFGDSTYVSEYIAANAAVKSSTWSGLGETRTYIDPCSVFYDDGLIGGGSSDTDKFVLVPNTDGFDSGFNNLYWKALNTTSWNWYGWHRANNSRTLNMFLIDPQYTIPYPSAYTSTVYIFIFQNSTIGNRVVVTDGWTSETVRNGKNIISVQVRSNQSQGARNWFGANSSIGPAIINCPDTYIVSQKNGSYMSGPFHIGHNNGVWSNEDINQITTSGDNNACLSLGSLGDDNQSSWSYTYFQNTTTSNPSWPSQNPEIGKWKFSQYQTNYIFLYTGGYTNLEFRNFFAGRGVYAQPSTRQNDSVIRFGSIYSWNQYTGSQFAYNGYNNVAQFIDGSMLYLQGSQFTIGYTPDFSQITTGIYRWDNSPIYTSAFYNGTTMGPLYGTALIPEFQSFTQDITLSSESQWYNLQYLHPYGGTASNYYLYVYGSGNWQAQYGKLITGGNYKNKDINLLGKPLKYTSSSYFGESYYTFMSNDYDYRPIMCLTAEGTSSIDVAPMVAVYNDATNNDYLCIQMNQLCSDSSRSYGFGDVIELPTNWQSTGGSSVVLTITGQINNTNPSYSYSSFVNKMNLFVYYQNSSGSPIANNVSVLVNTSTGVITGTFSVAKTLLEQTKNHIFWKLRFAAPLLSDYRTKIYIHDISTSV